MKSLVSLSSVFAIVLGANDAVLDFSKPAYTETITKTTPMNTSGSLFSSTKKHLFADLRAKEVNDILVVKIEQNSAISLSGKKKMAKNVSTGLNNPTLGKDLKELSPEFQKDYSATGTSSMTSDGQGNNSRNDKISATVSARIVEILNNGNYFIQGSKETFIDGEKTMIEVSGVIRPQDLMQDNTIKSELIADAKILYSTEGEIARALKPNKGTELIGKTNPY